jgi:hypothetical protein
MTRSILDDVLALETKSIEPVIAYFKEVGVDVFSPLYSLPDAYEIIMFILLAYSEESPMVICNQDYEVQKHNVCDKLEIADFKRGKFIRIKDAVIKKCVFDYLNDFAGAKFRHLQFLKWKCADAEEILTGMLCRTQNKDGDEVVITDEFDEATHSRLLKESRIMAMEIDKLEKDIKNKNGHLFIDKFFEKSSHSRKNESFTIESNPLIK